MQTECYVYEGNSVPPIVAGKYWIENGVGKFVYGKSYLNNPSAFAIDPINMPLVEAEFTPKRGKDRFNVLDDAGVDNWGRRLIVATHRAPKNAVEWLLSASGRGVGSLLFSGSRSALKPVSEPITLEQLGEYIKIIQGVIKNTDHFEIPQEFVKLVEHGQSMGGARPKTLVMHEGTEYIAKLNRSDDDLVDLSLIENAAMTLAKQSGIHVADTWCMDLNDMGHALLVKRFDRQPGSLSRTHYISAHSLLNMPQISQEDFAGDYSYSGIAKRIMAISAAPQEDAHELFRRMVYNGLIGNSDDHVRNHGFVLVDRQREKYRLSPAFDVLPQHRNHPQMLAIGCGTEGRLATYENLLSKAPSFYLSPREAMLIVDEVREHVSGYRTFFKEMGVGERDLKMIEPCFALAMEAIDVSVPVRNSRRSMPEPAAPAPMSREEFIASGNFNLVTAADAMQCIGRVLWADGDEAVQSLGRDRVVVHDMRGWKEKVAVSNDVRRIVYGVGPVIEPSRGELSR